jgi:hypothetical protein
MLPYTLEQEQQIRERLFDVLAEFPVLYQARQGIGSKILNPFASLDQVVRAHVNPLILYINDVVQEIQQGLSYLEALDRVVRFALQYKYRDRIRDAIRQLSQIERGRPYFLWGLAALLDGPGPSERSRRLRILHRQLHLMNQYYTQRFGLDEQDIDLIPWQVEFRDQVDGITDGTYDYPTRQQLEIFRTALGGLARLIEEHLLDRWTRRGIYNRIRKDMRELALLLFDYGYTVEQLRGRARGQDDLLSNFLDDLLLTELEASVAPDMDLGRVSRHIILLTLVDFTSMLPFRSFYRRLGDTQEALESAREIERIQKVRICPLRRLVQLHGRYQQTQSPILTYYLDYQFSRAYGDYLPSRDGGHFGVDITRRFVLQYFDKTDVQKKVEEEARKVYSSKASGEMLEVLRLLIQALSSPEKIRGKRVHLLGHIQSGAMGRVLIGIYKGNIAAFKEPKASRQFSIPQSERFQHLEYEARIHTHVQSGPSQHENIVECFGVVEEEGHRFLAIGYHPAETLNSLFRRATGGSRRGKPDGRPPFDLADLKGLSIQLLRVLLHLKERKVVHRDLKPSNILYLVDVDGRVSLIKIIDFGVALGLTEGLPEDIHHRQVVGTLGYMAPEMALREASYASDLYSAGVNLYQLMSGRLPVRFGSTKTPGALRAELKRVVQDKRTPLLEANPALAEEPSLRYMAEMVDQMIARDLARRPDVEALYEEWVEMWTDVPRTVLQRPIRYSS